MTNTHRENRDRQSWLEQIDDLDIAVIGLAGRFPGADNIDQYWRNLKDGVESVTFFTDAALIEAGVDPAMLAQPNYVKAASMLDDADRFDADFFGYSPKEASLTDPQGRLLLECAWEALEHAGYAPYSYPGAIGVYATASLDTYLLQNLHAGLNFQDFILSQGNINTVIGNNSDFMATRISYKLNLRGPSLDIQTACSSALVAVHMARQSLLSGECEMALAGGASLYLPQKAGYLYQEGLILSADGHCRPFDAAASGTIFGRGAGMVVLKPLREAIQDGDSIHAIIKGSAINNDGAAKVGFTAPSVTGQAQVITEALANADVDARTISYIEAHGTGTPQGDPIEVAGLTQAFRNHTQDNGFCALGTVKSNMGHLDVAAGIAGFIKTVLMLKNRQLPPSLHFETPNPQIDFEHSPFFVNTRLAEWSSPTGPRRAGVSAFGMGGTNAHVILEEAPRLTPSPSTRDRCHHLLTLSAKSQPALKQLAQRYQAHLAGDAAASLTDICFTAHLGREHFTHRLALNGAAKEELVEKLIAFAAGRSAPGLIQGTISGTKRSKLAFLFTGQGAQYAEMGRQLFETEPTFRETLLECDRLLRPYWQTSLLTILYSDNGQATNLLDETAYTQPAIFALEYALVTLWRSWGIEPDVVLGHSLGEYVAACVAGVFSLADGLKLVARRGQLVQALPSLGAMLVVFAGEAEVCARLVAYPNQVAVAALNGPDNTVIAGNQPAIAALQQTFEAEGIRCQRLKISHAFHSPLIEPMLDAFSQTLAEITFTPPSLRLISNLTGQEVTHEVATAAYWRRHLREPVRFAQTMTTLHQQGYDIFLEIGPSPVLLGMGKRCLPDDYGLWLSSLRQGMPDWQTMHDSLGALYTHGFANDWSGYEQTGRADQQRVVLPSYPFQRERHWQTPQPAAPVRPASTTGHPLLGQRLRSALKTHQFEMQFQASDLPYLQDHRIFEQPVFPATAYLELVLAAVRQTWGTTACRLVDVAFHQALSLTADPHLIQVMLSPHDDDLDVEIYSLAEAAALEAQPEQWTLHAAGKVQRVSSDSSPTPESPDHIQARCQNSLSGPTYYQQVKTLGFDYGPSFSGIETLWQAPTEVFAHIVCPSQLVSELPRYQAHPAYLDAGLQILLAFSLTSDTGQAYIPVSIQSFHLYRSPTTSLWSHARLKPQSPLTPNTLVGEVLIFDDAGQIIAALEGVRLKGMTREALQKRPADEVELYGIQWQAVPLAEEMTAAPEPYSDWSVDPQQIAAQILPGVPALSEECGMPAYLSLIAALDHLSLVLTSRALRQLGWGFTPGETVSHDSLIRKLGIIPRHSRLFDRLLSMLAEDGILKGDGVTWVVQQQPPYDDPETAWQALRQQYPDQETQLKLLYRCGQKLAEVLIGEQDPLPLLFQQGSLGELEELYTNAPFTRLYSAFVQQAFAAALRELPTDRPLRILEVGAGTGGTTSHVLPLLPAERVEYTFTDMSHLFLAKARDRYHHYPFMHYQILDIGADPLSQGFTAGSFDLILAANVLHATADLRQTLSHVRTLLSSEGLTVFVEGTGPNRWVDLTFGLTEGWWLFTDTDLRPSYPLLPPQRWVETLTELGFSAAVTLPDVAQGQGDAWQVIVLARGPSAGAASTEAKQPAWLIFMDEQGLGRALCRQLEAQGERCLQVFYDEALASPGSYYVNPHQPEAYASLITSLAEPGLAGVIHLWSLAAPAGDVPLDQLRQALELSSGSALYLTQALLSGGLPELPHLWLVTRGAQSLAQDELGSMAQTPLWGLAKVIPLEHPELSCTRLDLDPMGEADPAGEATLLLQEIRSGQPQEDQVAFRRQQRYLPRLTRLPDVTSGEPNPHAGPASPRQLRIIERGAFENLRLEPLERRVPGPGEVEIAVQMTGLNFKDVLNVLGLYPGDPGPLGLECVGTIVACGPDVTQFRIDAEVVALAPDSFGPYVTTTAALVLPKPAHLTAAEAVTIPVTFLTAYYSLHRLANISTGERVLIHAAAGGVGLAAVQLALRAGAELFCTAGSPEKRAYLESLGVQHVLDSRSLDFAEQVLALTGGEGVDVVLNSLADDFIPASLSVLNATGRFVEIGKAEAWDAGRVAALNPGVTYYTLDLGVKAVEDPPFVRAMFLDILDAFKAHTLRPLPQRVFPIQQAADAFRFMAQAKHIGKIVLAQETEPPASAVPIRSGGTYLLTGGLGDLGLLFAQWLVEQGARHLVLMGRSRPTPPAETVVAELTQQGIQVEIVQGDVAREADVARVLSHIEAAMPPLRGIIHGAGVLDDGMILQQNWARFMTVFNPKVMGAWNLHQQTRGMSLDFFISFSSIAALLGTAGQSNHAAANTFLDALAHYRRGQGLAGMSLNWGAWSDIGAAAQREIGTRIQKQGLGPISPQQGLTSFERALRQVEAQIGIVPVDWPTFLRRFPAQQIPGFYAEFVDDRVVDAAKPVETPDTGQTIVEELAELPVGRRRNVLQSYLKNQVALSLGLASGQAIEAQRPVSDYGLDSLMAVELRNTLSRKLGLSQPLPATLFFDYPTIDTLSTYLLGSVLVLPEPAPVAAAKSPVSEPEHEAELAELDKLSDEEIEQLLADELATLSPDLWGEDLNHDV